MLIISPILLYRGRFSKFLKVLGFVLFLTAQIVGAPFVDVLFSDQPPDGSDPYPEEEKYRARMSTDKQRFFRSERH